MKKRTPSELPKLGTHLWLVLYKACQSVRAHDLRSIEATGLNLTDFGVLEILLHKGALPVNTIGEKILLSSGSVTTAIDRLVQKGLVERQGSASDRRVRMVALTEAGRSLIEGAFDAHQEALEQATSGLSLADKKIMIDMLKRLGKHAQQLL